MSLAYYARNARSAERARRKMKREGCTMNGAKLWTEEECQIIREIGPDFDAIRLRLPHRTRIAIRTQCGKMGFRQKRQHIWSAAEISKLRRLYPSGKVEVVCEAFPHSTWDNIQQVARYHGFRRARRPFKPIGNVPVDEMLLKLFQANFSFPELDKELRTKGYFAKANWRYKTPNYNRLVKAIELLEGKLRVEWRE